MPHFFGGGGGRGVTLRIVRATSALMYRAPSGAAATSLTVYGSLSPALDTRPIGRLSAMTSMMPVVGIHGDQPPRSHFDDGQAAVLHEGDAFGMLQARYDDRLLEMIEPEHGDAAREILGDVTLGGIGDGNAHGPFQSIGDRPGARLVAGAEAQDPPGAVLGDQHDAPGHEPHAQRLAQAGHVEGHGARGVDGAHRTREAAAERDAVAGDVQHGRRNRVAAGGQWLRGAGADVDRHRAAAGGDQHDFAALAAHHAETARQDGLGDRRRLGCGRPRRAGGRQPGDQRIGTPRRELRRAGTACQEQDTSEQAREVGHGDSPHPRQEFPADDVQRLRRFVVEPQRVLGHAGGGKDLQPLDVTVEIAQVAGEAEPLHELRADLRWDALDVAALRVRNAVRNAFMLSCTILDSSFG